MCYSINNNVFSYFYKCFSRKVTWLNLSFTQELVTTMFVWVCCLAAASAFKTDSHMGFAYFTNKLTGNIKFVHRYLRIILCMINYGIWLYLDLKWYIVNIIMDY